MLRWLSLLALAATALVLVGAAAGGGAIHSSTPVGVFFGEWTPDTTADALLQDQPFYVHITTPTTARNDAGGFTPSFDQYCNPNAVGGPTGAVDYVVVNYSWDPVGTMGGCSSVKTGGHIYMWGSHNDVAYAHFGQLHGEAVLRGAWGVEAPDHSVDYQKFTAHEPEAKFLLHLQATSVLKGKHVVRHTTATGLGGIRFTAQPNDCNFTYTVGGFGAISVKDTKVGGPSVVELDALTLDVVATSGELVSCAASGDSLRGISVVVGKSDPAEKDACPVGSKGSVDFYDRSTAEGGDQISIDVPACKLNETFTQPKLKKGSHVAVAIDLNEKGY